MTKQTRINMAFTPENYDFIRRFSRLRGQSMTDFTNHMIDEYREEHHKVIKAFEEFIENT